MANQSIRFESVNVGDELQPVSVPITVPLIAGGAIATRDYFPDIMTAMPHASWARPISS
jgi:hypothetical protein